MKKLSVLFILIFIWSNNYGQSYKRHQSKTKHSGKIISIATSDSLFATSSYDKSFIVWDYSGKVVYSYKVANGKINSLAFANSKSLLVGVTEIINDKIQRHIIRCFDESGKIEYELIDDRLTQEYVNISFEKNVSGVRNAIDYVTATFPELNIKKSLEAPQVLSGLSHIELVQCIAVSPDNNTIASIDKFNILKTWDHKHKVLSSFKVINNKKDTNINFRSDSIIFIEPNIFLNIRDTSVQIIKGFERYSSILCKSSVYFHFNYNNDSRPEKLFDIEAATFKTLDSKNYYSITGSYSDSRLALLGVDGLIRVMNMDGEIISTFGKDRSEEITFRGEKVQLYSKICCLGFAPGGDYIISGDEDGKVIIWKEQ